MLLYKCIFLCYMSMERIKNLFSWPFPKFFLLLVGCDKKKKKKKSGTARETCVEVGRVFTGLGLWELSHLSVHLYTRFGLSRFSLFCLSYWCWWFGYSVVSASCNPWTFACQAPLSMGFSRQEYWSGLPFPSLVQFIGRSVVSDSLWPHRLQHARPPCPSPTPRVYQTHIHWVSDAIQPSHPLLSTSPPILNLFQHQGLFKWVSSSHQVAKVLEFQHQSFQWTPRTDLL